jgi:tubulin polyglutamylase TTLL4
METMDEDVNEVVIRDSIEYVNHDEDCIDDKYEDDNDDDDDDVDDNAAEVVDEMNVTYRDPPLGYLRLRPSKFKILPPTVFFEYPPELKTKRNDISYLEITGNKRNLDYSCHWERNCIKNAFKRAGFNRAQISDHKTWTTLWGKHSHMTNLKNYHCLQKVNHFPGSWAVGRKDRLQRTLTAMKRVHGSHYDFLPQGFILPTERNSLLRHLQTLDDSTLNGKHMFIMKPVASSCGKGIRLVSIKDILALPIKKKVLIQKYLSSTYLIEGHKFDLRIYVLLAGVDPLRVYVYDEGLVRIATCAYSLETKNRFAHLTNYSVNKKSTSYVVPSTDSSDIPAAATDSSKWSLATFKIWLATKTSQATVDSTFKRIYDLLVKTM